jgi:hypothetical protein
MYSYEPDLQALAQSFAGALLFMVLCANVQNLGSLSSGLPDLGSRPALTEFKLRFEE